MDKVVVEIIDFLMAKLREANAELEKTKKLLEYSRSDSSEWFRRYTESQDALELLKTEIRLNTELPNMEELKNETL